MRYVHFPSWWAAVFVSAALLGGGAGILLPGESGRALAIGPCADTYCVGGDGGSECAEASMQSCSGGHQTHHYVLINTWWVCQEGTSGEACGWAQCSTESCGSGPD